MKAAPLKAKTPQKTGNGGQWAGAKGYKPIENQTVQKIAWRIPWFARSKTEKLNLLQ